MLGAEGDSADYKRRRETGYEDVYQPANKFQDQRMKFQFTQLLCVVLLCKTARRLFLVNFWQRDDDPKRDGGWS